MKLGCTRTPQISEINRDVPNGTLKENTDIDIQVVINDDAPNGTPAEIRTPEIPHVARNSGENEWYTPKFIIDAARDTMTRIDLDPASTLIANEIVEAEEYFTKKEDGLMQQWYGNVWLNPPYAQPLIYDFSVKLVEELMNIEQACVLVNNATETEWLQLLLEECDGICFLKTRVRFIDMNGNPSGQPLQGQVVLYFGSNVKRFDDSFKQHGICMNRIEAK